MDAPANPAAQWRALLRTAPLSVLAWLRDRQARWAVLAIAAAWCSVIVLVGAWHVNAATMPAVALVDLGRAHVLAWTFSLGLGLAAGLLGVVTLDSPEVRFLLAGPVDQRLAAVRALANTTLWACISSGLGLGVLFTLASLLDSPRRALGVAFSAALAPLVATALASCIDLSLLRLDLRGARPALAIGVVLLALTPASGPGAAPGGQLAALLQVGGNSLERLSMAASFDDVRPGATLVAVLLLALLPLLALPGLDVRARAGERAEAVDRWRRHRLGLPPGRPAAPPPSGRSKRISPRVPHLPWFNGTGPLLALGMAALRGPLVLLACAGAASRMLRVLTVPHGVVDIAAAMTMLGASGLVWFGLVAAVFTPAARKLRLLCLSRPQPLKQAARLIVLALALGAATPTAAAALVLQALSPLSWLLFLGPWIPALGVAVALSSAALEASLEPTAGDWPDSSMACCLGVLRVLFTVGLFALPALVLAGLAARHFGGWTVGVVVAFLTSSVTCWGVAWHEHQRLLARFTSPD